MATHYYYYYMPAQNDSLDGSVVPAHVVNMALPQQTFIAGTTVVNGYPQLLPLYNLADHDYTYIPANAHPAPNGIHHATGPIPVPIYMPGGSIGSYFPVVQTIGVPQQNPFANPSSSNNNPTNPQTATSVATNPTPSGSEAPILGHGEPSVRNRNLHGGLHNSSGLANLRRAVSDPLMAQIDVVRSLLLESTDVDKLTSDDLVDRITHTIFEDARREFLANRPKYDTVYRPPVSQIARLLEKNFPNKFKSQDYAELI